MPFKPGNDLWKRREYVPGRSWNGKDIAYEVDGNGCWNCTSHPISSKGYPKIKRKGRSYRMSRYVLQEKLGREILPGYLACHKCNNRRCINPEHIYEGTPLENSKDSLNAGTARGAYMPGESNPNSLLTEDIVRYVKSHPEESVKSLSEKYDCSYMAIYKVRRGSTWGHVT